jgi:transcriptional regulator
MRPHGMAPKLTEQDVLAIRADDRTQTEIAAKYGVSHQNISKIKNGKAWTHI